MTRVELLEDPMYLALPREHALAGRDKLRLQDLRREAWVQTSRSSPCARHVVRCCHAAGFEPNVSFESDDYQTVQGLVAAGVGVALIPELALSVVREDVTVRALSPAPPVRRVIAAAPSRRPPGPGGPGDAGSPRTGREELSGARSARALAPTLPGPSAHVRGGCHRGGSMSVLLLILGVLLGGACAVVLVRINPNRERMRDELKAISVDVLAQTGDSLAQRLADQRRAEEERAAGEMARRAEEIKGLVTPVQEKLGRMESEIGRLERERRQAQGELAQMVRQLNDGRGHAAPGDRQPRLGAEAPHDARLLGGDPAAQRGRDGRHGLPLRLRRAEHDPRRRRVSCDPTCSCACPAES